MLMYNKSMGIILKEEQSGFTIIEVMLFLALTGFLLAGILVGAGSSIANQRYKDAIQDSVDAIRKAYSFVADTQIELRDGSDACTSLVGNAASMVGGEVGRGRTSCAVYGAVITIKKDTIQTTTLVGKDYYDVMMHADNVTECVEGSDIDYCKLSNQSNTDIEILEILKANNLFQSNNATYVAGNSSTRVLKWGTYFRKPIDSAGQEEGDEMELTLLIFRSPRDGSIRTLAMNDVIKDATGKPVDYREIGTTDDSVDKGVYKYISNGNFSAQDVYLCVDSGGAESYADHARMIRIMKNAHSQSGVKLEDFDATIYDSDGKEVLCDKK